jgi:hypothetical protein
VFSQVFCQFFQCFLKRFNLFFHQIFEENICIYWFALFSLEFLLVLKKAQTSIDITVLGIYAS